MLLPKASLKVLLLAGTALTLPAIAQELPSGGTVAAGSATISQPGQGALTVNQSSQGAVVNWQSFSIGQGGVVNIVQPDANAAILNRVTGSATTSIAGQLNANGQVYVVNPNGIAITQSGAVQAGSFVGSTLGISDDDFMSGNRTFTGDGSSAAVSNAGTIKAAPGGYAALIGGRVDNSGLISAPLGSVGLGAGEQVTLDLSGDGFLQVALPSDDSSEDLITHSGTISADGGRVVISAAAAQDAARRVVNLSGVVEARTVSGRNGSIVLGGGGGKVVVSGTLDASARISQPTPVPPPVPQPRPASLGGSVTVTGGSIALAGATIDVSGADGGGEVRIGGDFQGGGVLPRAGMLSVDDLTQISADATVNGDGGTVILWSDELTTFSGAISARGAGNGKGGDAEVSGKQLLAYNGTADLRSDSGIYGTLLLDPYNIFIVASDTVDNSGAPDFTPTGDDSQLDVATLNAQLELSNVTVSTGLAGSPGTQAGDIHVNANINWAEGPTVLTLEAANDIYVNAAITSLSGGANLVAGRDVWFGATTQGVVEIDVASSFFASAGRDIEYGSGAAILAGDSVGLSADRTLFYSGNITAEGNEIYFEAPTVDIEGTFQAADRVGINSTSTTIEGDVATPFFEAFAPGGTFTLEGGTSLDVAEAIIEAGTFNNNAGPGAIDASNRYLVYTQNWTGGNRGGLVANNLYGVTYGSNPPGSIGPGSYFLYADRPTLTITAPDGSRGVGETPLSGTATITGVLTENGDTVESALGDTPQYGENIDPLSPAGTYLEALEIERLASLIGYDIVYDDGDLQITPGETPPEPPVFNPIYPPTTSQATGLSPLAVAQVSDDSISGVVGEDISEADAALSLQVLTARTEEFKNAIAACELEVEQTDEAGSYITCLTDALEEYGEDIDDPLIKLPPELQATVTVVQQTVQRMRTAAANPSRPAAVAEARAAVSDLLDYVREQTDLVRAVEPETEAILVQHGEVMEEAFEQLDLALVGAVEI